MTDNNTEQIIQRIFGENFHALVFSSFRIVKDYQRAEDIVQDVFVKLWQNFDKVKHQDNLNSYIHTSIKNSSLNYLRDQKPDVKNTVSIESSNLEIHEEDYTQDNGEHLTKLHQAVDNLPENWREAFILSKYEKLKYYEIAEKMKISVKTVEKYISKALKTLRLNLKNVITIFLIIFSNKV